MPKKRNLPRPTTTRRSNCCSSPTATPRASLATQQAQQADYNKHLTAGNTAMAQKKYGDAIREYEAALRAVPNDPTALASLQQAKTLAKKK